MTPGGQEYSPIHKVSTSHGPMCWSYNHVANEVPLTKVISELSVPRPLLPCIIKTSSILSSESTECEVSGPMPERVAYSPQEFSALFGKSQTWGYRQIYAGKVEAISQFGRLMIPASEVERIVQTADQYSGRVTRPSPSPKKLHKVPNAESVWQKYLAARRTEKKQVIAQPSELRVAAHHRVFGKAGAKQKKRLRNNGIRPFR
jgi:hypothetical protein